MFTLSPTDSLSGIAGTGSAIVWTAFGDDVVATVDGFKVIGGPAFLTTSIASMIPAAAGEQRIISSLVLKNVTGSPVTIALYLNGTSALNQIEGLTIPANGKAIASRASVNVYDASGSVVTTVTITANLVDNTMLADMVQSTIKGRAAGAGTGDPTDLTPTQVKTLLAIANTDVSGLGTASTQSSSAFDTAGLAAAAQAAAVQRSNHTGSQTASTISDFTEASQDVIGAISVDSTEIDYTYDDPGNTLTIALKNASIALARMATQADLSVLGNVSGGAASPSALTATQLTTLINPATSALKGSLSAAFFSFLSAFNGSAVIVVTANAYSNLAVDGTTDDSAALTTLLTNAPDGSTLRWPGQNATMRLASGVSIPAGKHFRFQGGGSGGKTHILQTSLTADHITCGDWYSTFEGFDFTTNNTSATGVQALTSGTVLNVNVINTALVPASGSINIGSAIGWQVLTYSARTSNTITLSSTGTGNSIAGAPIVFKTAGAAINAGNLVGIDCIGNTFSYVFNGYICAGSTANQSRITGNGFLNTINFDIQIDAANWNGIIDSNTCDCTTNSRSVSHCEINQCGSVTGQGNQFIRGQYNLRLGSTTAAYPAGAFGVYFANSFFDNAGVDSVKVQGISAVQRVKLTSCWMSSAVGMGFNFASTASTLPSDIEIEGCNIYGNGSNGIGGAGYLDYKVSGGQVAGNVTAGISILPVTGGVSDVQIIGTRIGPVGGFGANGTGIIVGAGTYLGLKISKCNVFGNTTNFTLGAVTVTTASRFSITGNSGINPRGAVATPAYPATTVVVTNTTGFKVLIVWKTGAITNTALTINGVVCVFPTILELFTVPLEPGGTVALAYTGTAGTWTWVGQ